MTASRWRSIGSYGRTTQKIIKKLEKKFDSDPDPKTYLDVARTIGYLISVQKGLIKEHNLLSLEKRIEELEKHVIITEH